MGALEQRGFRQLRRACIDGRTALVQRMLAASGDAVRCLRELSARTYGIVAGNGHLDLVRMLVDSGVPPRVFGRNRCIPGEIQKYLETFVRRERECAAATARLVAEGYITPIAHEIASYLP
jgi:hypothetical protein